MSLVWFYIFSLECWALFFTSQSWGRNFKIRYPRQYLPSRRCSWRSWKGSKAERNGRMSWDRSPLMYLGIGGQKLARHLAPRVLICLEHFLSIVVSAVLTGGTGNLCVCQAESTVSCPGLAKGWGAMPFYPFRVHEQYKYPPPAVIEQVLWIRHFITT